MRQVVDSSKNGHISRSLISVAKLSWKHREVKTLKNEHAGIIKSWFNFCPFLNVDFLRGKY